LQPTTATTAAWGTSGISSTTSNGTEEATAKQLAVVLAVLRMLFWMRTTKIYHLVAGASDLHPSSASATLHRQLRSVTCASFRRRAHQRRWEVSEKAAAAAGAAVDHALCRGCRRADACLADHARLTVRTLDWTQTFRPSSSAIWHTEDVSVNTLATPTHPPSTKYIGFRHLDIAERDLS